MKLKSIFLLLAILSLMLVACGGGAAPAAEPAAQEEPAVVEEPTEAVVAEPTQEVMEEPTAEEPTPEMAEADLDGAFNTFLAGMENALIHAGANLACLPHYTSLRLIMERLIQLHFLRHGSASM